LYDEPFENANRRKLNAITNATDLAHGHGPARRIRLSAQSRAVYDIIAGEIRPLFCRLAPAEKTHYR